MVLNYAGYMVPRKVLPLEKSCPRGSRDGRRSPELGGKEKSGARSNSAGPRNPVSAVLFA